MACSCVSLTIFTQNLLGYKSSTSCWNNRFQNRFNCCSSLLFVNIQDDSITTYNKFSPMQSLPRLKKQNAPGMLAARGSLAFKRGISSDGVADLWPSFLRFCRFVFPVCLEFKKPFLNGSASSLASGCCLNVTASTVFLGGGFRRGGEGGGLWSERNLVVIYSDMSSKGGGSSSWAPAGKQKIRNRKGKDETGGSGSQQFRHERSEKYLAMRCHGCQERTLAVVERFPGRAAPAVAASWRV